MAFGLGLGCCCNRCAALKNCETEGVITSTSDLSAYEVGDVLLRDASEGGGCWEILSLTAACISPETFTVAGGPFTGETACQDCDSMSDPDFQCGDYCLAAANGLIDNVNFDGSQNIPQDTTLVYANGAWTGDISISGTGNSDCDGTYQIEIWCVVNELRILLNGLDQTFIESDMSAGGYHIFEPTLRLPSPCDVQLEMTIKLPEGDCPV